MKTPSLQLRIDEWTGTSCKHVVVANVTTLEFNAWLDQMDAERHTLLMLSPTGVEEPVAHFAIGGGRGRYVVYMTEDNQSFWSLLSKATKETKKVLLMAGGQEGDYPLRRIVDLDQARSAGHAYIALGGRDLSQEWECD